MNKERLIQKWLDNDLSTEEKVALQQLEEYEDYKKIVEAAENFKAPAFDSNKAYDDISKQVKQPSKKVNWLNITAKIAAVLAISFACYYAFFHNSPTTVQTIAGTTENIVLPDSSLVNLNADTQLTYNKNDWNERRVIHLEGEAFFKVTKGKTFEVKTDLGIVTVLGTQFNVKQRMNYFEVLCYEGLVQVEIGQQVTLLPAGNTLRIINQKEEKNTTSEKEPSWLNGISSFKSVPFKEVIDEAERQYDIDIQLKKLTFDTEELYTGSFVHHDLETALQSITVPFNLTYKINGSSVIIKESE